MSENIENKDLLPVKGSNIKPHKITNAKNIMARKREHQKFIDLIVMMLSSNTLPYYAEFNTFINFYETTILPTCAVNISRAGMNFYWNRKFVDALTDEEAMFLLLHEDFHLLFDHAKRTIIYNKEFANIVTDMIINQIIFDEIMKHDKTKGKVQIPKHKDEFILDKDDNPILDEKGNKIPNPYFGKNSGLFIPAKYPGEPIFENLYEWMKEEHRKYKQKKSKQQEEENKNKCSSCGGPKGEQKGDQKGNQKDSQGQSDSGKGESKDQDGKNGKPDPNGKGEGQGESQQNQDQQSQGGGNGNQDNQDQQNQQSQGGNGNGDQDNQNQDQQSKGGGDGNQDNQNQDQQSQGGGDGNQHDHQNDSQNGNNGEGHTCPECGRNLDNQSDGPQGQGRPQPNTDGNGNPLDSFGNPSHGKYGKNGVECQSLDSIFDSFENGDQVTLDSHLDDEVPEAARKSIVNDFMQRLKNRGLQSGDVETVLNKLRKSKHNYLKEIKRTMSNHIMGHAKRKSITRPHRRQIEGLKGKKKYRNVINCILDTSGSMGGDFERVLAYIFQNDIHINLIQIDTEVKKVENIKNKRDLQRMAIHGLGGTVLQPAVNFILNPKNKLHKFNTVILTDGYTDSLNFSECEHKVLILTTGKPPKYKDPKGKVKTIVIDKENSLYD